MIRCRNSTHQQNFDSTDDVHGRRDAGAEVEENSYGPSELRPESTRDEEVGASCRYHPVRGDGAHADGCGESLCGRGNDIKIQLLCSINVARWRWRHSGKNQSSVKDTRQKSNVPLDSQDMWHVICIRHNGEPLTDKHCCLNVLWRGEDVWMRAKQGEGEVLTQRQQMKTIRNPSSQPAMPTTHTRRMKRITPKMFWMHGKYTPKIVPSFCFGWKQKQKIVVFYSINFAL